MRVFRPVLVLFLSVLPALSATFGTPVQHPSPLVDLAYDSARKRLYVLSPLSNTLEVYDTTAKVPTLLAKGGTITVDANPVSMALSWPVSGASRYLYVACYTGGVIDQIDLATLTRTGTISLPANPEAVAIGFDGKLLISTIGTPQGQFVLTTYDPNSGAANALQAVTVTPPAPAAPTVPPPNGLPYLAVRAHLVATPDGQTIIGVHEPANNTRTVFVYQVSSATMLRSRSVSVGNANFLQFVQQCAVTDIERPGRLLPVPIVGMQCAQNDARLDFSHRLSRQRFQRYRPIKRQIGKVIAVVGLQQLT